MSLKLKVLAGVFAGAFLAACTTQEEASAPTPTAEGTTTTPAAAETPAGPEKGSMDWALAGDWRVAPERDGARHPKETLAFFGVEADDTVVEIWPGGGWYTSVLGPYLKEGGGKLIAAGFDPAGSDYAKRGVEKYTEAFINKPDVYGEIVLTVASKTSSEIAPEGSADVVLTFRNVHNWMFGDYADKMFKDAYTALKPGGVLGVVEHRLPSSAEQDPKGGSGYVQEELVKQWAAEAGFEFVEASEINANPKDTADHPFGVWTLPPNSRTAGRGEEPNPDFDKAKYAAIGESDRMTLKFVKPVAE